VGGEQCPKALRRTLDESIGPCVLACAHTRECPGVPGHPRPGGALLARLMCGLLLGHTGWSSFVAAAGLAGAGLAVRPWRGDRGTHASALKDNPGEGARPVPVGDITSVVDRQPSTKYDDEQPADLRVPIRRH